MSDNTKKQKPNTNDKKSVTLIVGILIGAVTSFTAVSSYYFETKKDLENQNISMHQQVEITNSINEQLTEIQKELIKQRNDTRKENETYKSEIERLTAQLSDTDTTLTE